VKPSPDVIVILTDEERAAPSYESVEVRDWRARTLASTRWFEDNAVSFERHYTGSLACVPSRPTMFTGHYPDLHGVTQTDGLGKTATDSRMRWLPPGEVPTLGNWFRAAGYDTHYDGKWHISHADLIDPATGRPVATNTADGTVIAAGVRRYLDSDRLAAYGFSGWVGPEPHGAGLADSGLRRDPLLADRSVAWLTDRYARRAAGDEAARKPFLMVVSFVNPHDIVLFPAWVRRSPIEASPLDPPHVPEAPTAHEDLSSKPAAQVAYRASYPSAYGPAPAIERIYRTNAQRYRDLYYRLHAEVDGPIDRVRRAVTDGSDAAVIVRTADHGELLGAHGGLHQKWFNLYDEATRIPFFIARVGPDSTEPRTVRTPTSHVDLVPTLLAAAGLDETALAGELSQSFSEVHPLPGRNLMLEVDGADPDAAARAVYLLTRDNMLEGDSGASGLARRLGVTTPPAPLRIQVAAHVGSSFEGVVAAVAESDTSLGAGHLWKLVRTFDDPSTWTTPGVQQLAANGVGGPLLRRDPLPDEWELYDLDADPNEAVNHALDPAYSEIFEHLQWRLKEERHRSVPERNNPWPYAVSRIATGGLRQPPPAARLVRKVVQRIGMHPEPSEHPSFDLAGRRALIVCTNHAVLDIGKATGVFASEMTAPYYLFLDAGMRVDLASPAGGPIPVDPLSLRPVIRTPADDRFLADETLRGQIMRSVAIGDVDIADYDLLFLAGGWGAAFDFAVSRELGDAVTAAAAAGVVIGGICHGPLGLVNASGPDGRPLVEGRRVSAVTNKQIRELRITATPYHPETELRRCGAEFESETRFRDPFANHWVADGDLVTGQNQNAGPMVAQHMMGIIEQREARA
jgi:arylsulfatase A-like enzyme/putative intracellular protease/amidase